MDSAGGGAVSGTSWSLRTSGENFQARGASPEVEQPHRSTASNQRCWTDTSADPNGREYGPLSPPADHGRSRTAVGSWSNHRVQVQHLNDWNIVAEGLEPPSAGLEISRAERVLVFSHCAASHDVQTGVAMQRLFKPPVGCFI